MAKVKVTYTLAGRTPEKPAVASNISDLFTVSSSGSSVIAAVAIDESEVRELLNDTRVAIGLAKCLELGKVPNAVLIPADVLRCCVVTCEPMEEK